jgi:NAD(P)-dependent dehydrogenase (short-subunit alcohol dehydrogenase family)
MAASKGVLFILGGGPRIGHSVAAKFLKEGYQVAIGRRTISPLTETNLSGAISIKVDVTKTESVAEAFHKVKAELGIPNVVVYNG